MQLEGPTRAMAELVAVAGKPIPPEVVAAAARVEAGEFNRRVAMLRASHLVRTGGTRWQDAVEPYHDRVREAVLAQLDPGRKRSLHEALAVAFESWDHADPETLAAHWRDAGNARRAGKHAMRAGEQASRKFAFERAAEWYQRALEWLPGGEVDRAELEVKIGNMLASAGQGALAAPHFQAAAAVLPPMQALDLRRRAAEELLSAGRFEEGDAVLKAVLEAVGIDLPRTPLAALFGLLFFRFIVLVRGLGFRERTKDDIAAHALTRLEACNGVGRALALVDTIRGAYFQTRALLGALTLGEPAKVARSLAIEAIYLAAQGSSARATRLLVQARALAGRKGDLQLQAFVETTTGFTHFVVGEFDAGLPYCDRSADVLRENCPGAWWELRTAQMAAMWIIAWKGDLNELSARVEKGTREARSRGDIYAGTSLRTGVLNLAWLRGGDASEARKVVRDAMGQWTQSGYHSQHFWALIALARIDLYEGSGRDAHDRIGREWLKIARAMILRMRIMGAEVRHLRACAALATAAPLAGTERLRLIRAAEGDARILAGMRWKVSTAFAASIRGGAAALRGKHDVAAAELRAAAKEYGERSMELHAASARWQLGRLLGGDEGEALAHGSEAWMTGQGVVDCAAMAGMLTPGIGR
jgi:tetratricopeptide (TPR) repeat protein